MNLVKKSLFRSFSIWPLLCIGLSIRLINIHAPILGMHSWRQADTAAIARNFIGNGLIFWQPQVDWGGSTSGFVECEFPLYQYLVALIYKLFGVNEIFARGLSILFSCLTLWLLFRLVKKLLGVRVAWWGALFYSILPISVFYGRTVQPESLMMFLSILSLERWIAYINRKNTYNLLFSFLAFTLAVLIKVLPFIWIGIPILFTSIQSRLLFKKNILLYPLITILVSGLWYVYSYRLGQSTGLTFGLWGTDTNRYSWDIFFTYRTFVDLFIRIICRNFLLIGFPLFCLGFFTPVKKTLFIVGIISVFLTGVISPVSFVVHEYYQLPLMLFICPIMGLGMDQISSKSNYFKKYTKTFIISLLFISSIFMLSIDYWSLENPKIQPVWENAELIKRYTKPTDQIISVTGGDPTLLYLSNRKGWLASPDQITLENMNEWKRKGAKYISGSWRVIESYKEFNNMNMKSHLKQVICIDQSYKDDRAYIVESCFLKNDSFLIPLND